MKPQSVKKRSVAFVKQEQAQVTTKPKSAIKKVPTSAASLSSLSTPAGSDLQRTTRSSPSGKIQPIGTPSKKSLLPLPPVTSKMVSTPPSNQ